MIIAGTGHRPKYLPCKYNEEHEWLTNLRSVILGKLISIEPTRVISGAAIGFDTWLAESAISLNIPLSLYIPYEEHGSFWPTANKKKLAWIKSKASEVKVLSDKYNQDCFFIRDKAMVDDADKVVALWNPEIDYGGTHYTVQYIKKCKKELINLWLEI